MVSLPRLEDYNQSQWAELENNFPVCAHYRRLIGKSPQTTSEKIRFAKHRSWLQCALATFFEKAPAEQICLFWSEQTDLIITQAWKECGLDSTQVGLIAMGKLGSSELNLSSDIDILIVADNSADLPLPAVRSFIKLLSETTSWGFAYRIDLNLRPGGESSPLISQLQQFYNYYDEYLEAWHRMSFIRWRPILGKTDLLQSLTRYTQRICFPRRLDFGIIKDIKSVRGRLNQQWVKKNEQLNIKFHPGGIRDIELYVHALQVIYGGKQVSAQQIRFSDALSNLASLNVIPNDEYQFLQQFYWKLRTLENLIHISEDQHSYVVKPHILKNKACPFSEEQLRLDLSKSNQLVSDFFTEETNQLKEYDQSQSGSFSPVAEKAISDILELRSHSLRNSDTEKLKRQILAQYLEHVEKIAIDQELAVQTFRDFVHSIRAKSSVFHLLARNSELLENLAWLFSVSPYMGQVICRRPELLDSFSLGSVSLDDLTDLEDLLEGLHDYKLLGNLVSVIYLLKNQDILAYGKSLSERADQVGKRLLNFISQSIDTQPLDILCLGKWGGEELGIQSDLDLVFLSSSTPESSQVQIARKFVNLLTTRQHAGALYNVDLRLKPEETAVPLMIQDERLERFLASEADPWQKQAYLRARRIGDSEIFFKDKMDLLFLNREEEAQLGEIHNKLLTTQHQDWFDIKTVQGGLLHTEFTVQKKILSRKISSPVSTTMSLIDLLETPEGSLLKKNYFELRKLEQIFQLCNDSSRTKVQRGSSGLARASRILHIDNIFDHFSQMLSHQSQLLKTLDLNS